LSITNKQRRPRRQKKKHMYFRLEHEQAIIEYIKSDDSREREELYIKMIQPVFSEMVDKIVFRFRFTALPNSESLREECKSWLNTVIDKFDPDKGHKAFAYFSVITKNWFIQKTKKNKRKNYTEVNINEMSKKAEIEFCSTENEYEKTREADEFLDYLWEEIETWDVTKLKSNDRKVIEAIKILLQSSDDIEIFNKKAIYLYMREITGLSTKQIVNSLNKIRTKYKVFRGKWNDGQI